MGTCWYCIFLEHISHAKQNNSFRCNSCMKSWIYINSSGNKWTCLMCFFLSNFDEEEDKKSNKNQNATTKLNLQIENLSISLFIDMISVSRTKLIQSVCCTAPNCPLFSSQLLNEVSTPFLLTANPAKLFSDVI